MKLAIGADHAGYAAKEHLKGWLVEHGHEVRHAARVEKIHRLEAP